MPTPVQKVTIRAFVPADTTALRVILNEIVDRGDAFLYETQFSDDSALAWVTSHSAAFVAEVDDRVVAGYVLRPNQPGRGSHVCNAAYMVSEAARGHGLGHALGEHSLIEAKHLGFASMQFNAVVSTNTHAVALWKSLGFEIIGTIPRAFRHKDRRFVDLHLMHRAL